MDGLAPARLRQRPSERRPTPASVTEAGATPLASAVRPPHWEPARLLTDAEWERIQPLLPKPSGRGRPARHHRHLVSGMLWLHRTGASWRELPAVYGPWPTVDTQYRRWSNDGTWPRLLTALHHKMQKVSL